MRKIRVALITVCLFVIEVAASDTGDEFSNNLFTDFGPLLSLFGEQFAKQFLSQSVGLLDCLIFALIPLGVLTAIVSAIRVGGPSWLRALIGRTRENRAAAELELMSSTSHEVCELWNGAGLVRTLGKPKMKEIIYLEDDDVVVGTERTYGLYTVETLDTSETGGFIIQDCRDPLVVWVSWLFERMVSLIIPRGKEGSLFAEESGNAIETGPRSPACAPNVALNLHGTSQTRDLIFVAVVGFVMQFGILAYAALTVYHPSLKEKFPKDGKSVQTYAFPLMASGSILLLIGIFVCAFIVDRSTDESEVSRRGKGELNARILWIQQCHDVSDQSFDAYVIYGRNKRKDEVLNRILRSRRNLRHGRPLRDVLPKRLVMHLLPQQSSLRTMEFLTVFGTTISLSGFICQFQGFRGLNWTVSIAQLIGIGGMTALRAWLRRGLNTQPIARQVPEDHELDDLALQIIGKCSGPRSGHAPNGGVSKESENSCHFWPTSDSDASDLDDLGDKNKYSNRRLWWITNQLPTTQTRKHQGGSSSSIRSSSTLNKNQLRDAMNIRRRLWQLTHWETKTTQLAKGIATCIEIALDGLGAPNNQAEFVWKLVIGTKDENGNVIFETVEFEVEKRGGSWKSDPTFIDAALSLWLFHIRHASIANCSGNPETPRTDTSDDFQYSGRNIQQTIGRTLGMSTRGIEFMETPIGRDLLWWIGDKMESIEVQAGVRDDDSQSGEVFERVGFLPKGTKFESEREPDPHSSIMWGLTTDSPLESLLAQHMFMAFMWQLAEANETFDWDSQNHTNVVLRAHFRIEDPESIFPIKMENKTLQKISTVLQKYGIATTIEEAYYCIIPPLSYYDRLPISFVYRIMKEGKSYERENRWEAVIPSYIRLFNECFSSCPQKSLVRAAVMPFVDLHCFLNNSVTLSLRQETGEDNKISEFRRFIKELEDVYEKLKQRETEAPYSVYRTVNPSKVFEAVASFYRSQNRYEGKAWLLFVGESFKDFEDFETSPYWKWALSYLQIAVLSGIPHDVKQSLESKAKLDKMDDAGYIPLHYAIERYDDISELMEVVRLLIDRSGASGLDVSNAAVLTQKMSAGRSGQLPIHIAARLGKDTFVKALYDAGSSLEIADVRGQTPLHLAAFHGSRQCVETLLSHGARLDALDLHQRTPFHLAALSSNLSRECVEVFTTQINYTPVSGLVDRHKRTALHLAAISGNVEMVRNLSSRAVFEHNARDEFSKTALYYAIEKNKKAVVKILIEAGITDVATEEGKQTSALHVAAEYGSENVGQFLVDYSMPVDVRDEKEQTPLHIAALKNQQSIVAALVEGGADVNASDLEGFTPLHKAIKAGHKDFVLHLLRTWGDKVDVSARCKLGYAPFQYATKATTGDVRLTILRALSRFEGAGPDVTNPAGMSAFHEAVSNLDVETAELLLSEFAADINKPTTSGEQPVHIVINKTPELEHYHWHWQRIIDFVQFLKERGCNIGATDENGRTILHIAAQRDWLTLMKSLVLSEDVDWMVPDRNGCLPIHLLGPCKKENVFQSLIALQAKSKGHNSINTPCLNPFGRTALHIASCRCNINVRLLLRAGAQVDIFDAEGYTALHLAIWYSITWGYNDIVKLLLTVGNANVELRTRACGSSQISNLTALQLALKKASLQESEGWIQEKPLGAFSWAISVLLETGKASVDAVYYREDGSLDEEAGNTLHVAAKNKQLGMILPILVAHADEEALLRVDGGKRTPLHLALTIKQDHIRLMGTIITRLKQLGKAVCGRVLGATDFNGHMPLHIAASMCDADAVRILLGEGALFVNAVCEPSEVDLVCGKGSAFHHVMNSEGSVDPAQEANPEAKKDLALFLLYTPGFDPYVFDGDGNTTLHLAAGYGSEKLTQEILTLITKHALDDWLTLSVQEESQSVHLVCCRNQARETALHVAAKMGHPQVLRILLRHASMKLLFRLEEDLEKVMAFVDENFPGPSPPGLLLGQVCSAIRDKAPPSPGSPTMVLLQMLDALTLNNGDPISRDEAPVIEDQQSWGGDSSTKSLVEDIDPPISDVREDRSPVSPAPSSCAVSPSNSPPRLAASPLESQPASPLPQLPALPSASTSVSPPVILGWPLPTIVVSPPYE